MDSCVLLLANDSFEILSKICIHAVHLLYITATSVPLPSKQEGYFSVFHESNRGKTGGLNAAALFQGKKQMRL